VIRLRAARPRVTLSMIRRRYDGEELVGNVSRRGVRLPAIARSSTRRRSAPRRAPDATKRQKHTECPVGARTATPTRRTDRAQTTAGKRSATMTCDIVRGATLPNLALRDQGRRFAPPRPALFDGQWPFGPAVGAGRSRRPAHREAVRECARPTTPRGRRLPSARAGHSSALASLPASPPACRPALAVSGLLGLPAAAGER
jgi:hypothetical protein